MLTGALLDGKDIRSSLSRIPCMHCRFDLMLAVGPGRQYTFVPLTTKALAAVSKPLLPGSAHHDLDPTTGGGTHRWMWPASTGKATPVM